MESRLYKRGFDDTTAALQQKLGETTILLEVLSKVNSLIATSKSFENFCAEVGNILKKEFKFPYIHIWIREEPNGEVLKLLTPENAGEFRETSIHRGIVGRAIRENRTIVVPDVKQDPNYVNVHPEVVSELCVPLNSEDHVIGVLNIETDYEQNFVGFLQVIELVAANLGHALRIALLYQTEEYFHNLVENMNEGVWVVNEHDRTVYTNPALQKMTGYTEEELKHRFSFDFFDAENKLIVEAESQQRKYGVESHYEATIITKNGESIPILIHAVPFANKHTMATVTDLRDIKQAEHKLLRAERFLASITQNCPEAIVGLNEQGVIQSWNVGAERMFGYKALEVLGKSTEAVIMPEDRVAAGELKQLIAETKNKGFVRNVETTRIHKNGQPINISLTFSCLKDNDGHILGLSAFYRDITAQKKWEHELQDRFEKIQDAYKEMGRQRRHLDYLMDLINMMSLESHSRKQVASFLVNALVMGAKVDGATLRLLEQSTGKLILVAQSGLGEEWWSKKSIAYAGSLAEVAFSKRQPLKILDILNDPRYMSPALARKFSLRSALVIPLEAKGEFLGSLTLYLSQEGNLNLLDDEFIAMFAKQGAIALKLAG